MVESRRLGQARGVYADRRRDLKFRTESIPESLWHLALSLLSRHTIAEVCRQDEEVWWLQLDRVLEEPLHHGAYEILLINPDRVTTAPSGLTAVPGGR